MGNKQNVQTLSEKAENLKLLLKEFGINSPKELDDALPAALGAVTIGIMTDKSVHLNSSMPKVG